MFFLLSVLINLMHLSHPKLLKKQKTKIDLRSSFPNFFVFSKYFFYINNTNDNQVTSVHFVIN